jgi:glycerol-3-phosphate acyltransferase PlsY
MIVVLVGITYLLGSIPIAWFITKLMTGQDLRNQGSGNVGVMNVMIHTSRWAGLLVFFAEALKGILAVMLAGACGGGEIMIMVAVITAVVGTRWPVWLHFHGGRGNTVGFGALLVISWQTLLICLAVWGLLRFLIRDSFWATRLALILAPIIFGGVMGSAILGLMAVPLCLVYLSTQEKGTDDHLAIKQNWSSFAAFLTAPPRHRKRDI